MARLTRTASFSDNDLEVINSQAANMSLYNGGNTPSTANSSTANAKQQPEIVDLSSSPAPAPAYRSLNSLGIGHPDNSPVFGKPGKLMSSLKQKAANAGHLFYQPKNRPELHRQKQEAHVRSPAKNQPELFSSLAPDAQPAPQYVQSAYYRAPQSKAAYKDPTFYTDPAKAEADLKALLEGGMEEDDDDDDNQDDEEREEKENAKGTLEDGTVEGVKVKLLPHQVAGLKWMKGRELGPVKRGKVPKGGILADDMGLGKTLQSISLILSNPRPDRDSPDWKKSLNGVERGTLVVAPLALIRQWEAELTEKVSKSHRLSVLVHHGPNRTKRFQDLAKYDVVITTYQIVASEHKHSSDTVKTGCFGLRWYRIILDEAHTIKNRSAKTTKACCALDSEFRWCLTGTPMQNNLDELQSLVHFLRVQPYDSFQRWRDEIDKPLKNGNGHIAIERLHALLRSFMKRRTKDILKEEGALLPGGKKALEAAAGDEGVDAPTSKFKITERKVVAVKVQFSSAEQRFYDTLSKSTDKSLAKMMQSRLNYANALVLLLRLRQACNHPKLAERNLEDDTDALTTEGPTSRVGNANVDELADAFGGMGLETKKCGMCLQEISRERAEKGEAHCQECAGGLATLYSESPILKKSKKQESIKSKTRKAVKTEKNKRTARKRNVVMDSDDEEGDGSWLVGEDHRGALRLGKAGGSDDENAEGEGEDIGSDDSVHHSEDEDGSRLGSFVVDDEDASQQPQADSDDETFVSVDKMMSQSIKLEKKPRKTARRIVDSEDESAADSEEEESSEEEDSEEDGSDSSEEYPIQARQRLMGSAKIREVIRILDKEAEQHKFIVFSQFTSMLDLVEPYLDREGFKYVRYDGQMKNDAREESLYRLRNDKRVRVLLCSLKCGSLGLNLTAATRVIIIEPFWNPVSWVHASRPLRMSIITDL